MRRTVVAPERGARRRTPQVFCRQVIQEGRGVRLHRAMHDLYPRLVELGVLAATRPPEVSGQRLPMTVASIATAYLMAANLSAYGYLGLTTGAARLIESFGSDELKAHLFRLLGEEPVGC